MAVSDPSNDSVVINGERYSLYSEPPPTSALVLREREDLLGCLDLNSLVKDLGRVGKCIRVAYNGIGAAGPKFTDLKIEVQQLGYDISKLCDKSAVTVAKFKTTTRTILVELQATYRFLLDNMEEMAIDTFSTLAELAGKMATAAAELQQEFENQETKVIQTLKHTQSKKGDEELRIEELQRKQEEMKAKIKVQENLVKEHSKLEEEARAERRRYEKKEDKELSSESSFFRKLGNVVTSSFGLGELFGSEEDAARRATKWGEKSIQQLQIEKEQRKLRHDALEQMAQFAYEVKDSETQENLADSAVKALHEVIRALKQLSVIMRQAVLFWNQLQEHCRGLADAKVQQQIGKMLDVYSLEKRMKHWTSPAFKQKIVLYYAKWVALYGVTSEYLEQIKTTQQDLYEYIKENPTTEQSLRNLKQLAEDFLEDLKSAQDDIRQKDLLADSEILQLKAGN